MWLGVALIWALSSPYGGGVAAAAPAPAPVVIEVNTTNDGDNLDPGAGCDADAAAPGEQCTLRAAIQRANALAGDIEIKFNIPAAQPNCDAATGRCTINLTKALPAVNVDVSIAGPGAGKLTVRRDTGGNYRIFTFSAAVQTATVSGLTISNGFTPEAGGGILSQGKTLNVSGCVFSENTAADAGGGISADGTLGVTDSTFSGNLAPGVRGGGGIHALGPLGVTRSTFDANRSDFRGGAISAGSLTAVELRVTDSTFERNGANTGGAIGMYSVGSVLHVTNSTIRLNTTTGFTGGIYQSLGTLNVTNSSVRDNEGFGLTILPANGFMTETNIIGSTISGNARGGITTAITPTVLTKLNITNSTISDNQDDPGITIANRATLNVTNSTIARNALGGIRKVETASNPGTWTVKSSIIALNGGGEDVRGDFTSGGFNLIGKTDGSTGFTQPTDRTGTNASPLDPRLDPAGLKNNGGLTETIALFPGSPAVDGGTADGLNGPLNVDQRGTGFMRNSDNPAVANAGDGTDIGAFERNPADPIPPTVLQLSAATYSVSENGASAAITVTRSGDNANAVSVRYATGAATATAGTVDYTDVAGTLNWAAGDISPKTFTVPITNDASDEDNETVALALSDPQGGAALGGQSQAVLTIVDDDAAPVLSLGFASVNEGNSGVVNMTVPVTLSVASGKVVTVRAGTVAGGTATPTSDYLPIDNVLVTFIPGQTQASVTVQVVGDTESEPDETIFVKLTNATNGQIGGFQVATRIRNDDVDQATGELKFGAASYTVNEGDSAVTVEVTRTGSTSGAATVSYTMASGTAASGSDYTNTFGSLTFESGQASKSFSIPIINDSAKEPDETTTLTLSNPTGGVSLGTPSMAVLTIVDDDPQPSISIGDFTVSEGDTGAAEARFTVNLSAPTFQTVTVKYGTDNGTAAAGSDYQAASGFLTFNPGESSKTVNVAVSGDTAVEQDETFFVNLSDPQNATLGDGQGAGNILNDDDGAVVLQLDSSAYSAGEGTGSISIVVNRTGDASAAASVDYRTGDESGLTPCQANTGLASERCDYATAAGTLTFAPGERQKGIRLALVDDAYVEGPEQLSIKLSNPQGGAVGSNDQAAITIADNDAQAAQNPLADPAFFVRQHYIDFLGREPEPQGLQGWLGILNNCGTTVQQPCDRIEVSSAFFRSEEFQTRGYFVYRFYGAGLGRLPKYSEFIPDMARVSGFLSGQELESVKVSFIQEFMTRGEFRSKYDPTLNDPAAYVDLLEQTAGVSLSGKQALVTGLLNGTETRATALRKVIESSEVAGKFFNEAFVVEAYFGYLRRDPDILYLQWIESLNQTGDYRALVNGFMNSTEYAQRFGH
jgi:CSLREA domain-containing protein